MRATAPRILLVEDEPTTREVLTAILRGEGYEVDSVASTGAATTCLQSIPYELVIADWVLPDGDGIAALQAKYRSTVPKRSDLMRRPAAYENHRVVCPPSGRADPSASDELHVIGTRALSRMLPEVRSDRERFLSMLRSRDFLPHTDAIEALWGENSDGGPLYAQHILAIYVARLRRAGHAIENYRGIGYRIHEPGVGIAAEWAEQT